ncbi:MAG: myo-inositol-1-phosphate synthase [Saprospiraceae bacterium]|jgi:myo-inositol-1-phosphate synthase
MSNNSKATKPTGTLGILTPGMGAVATTFIAGCIAIKKGMAKPIGSLTQMGHITAADGSRRRIDEIVPLQALGDVIFGGWDVHPDSVYDAAVNAKVIDRYMIEQLKPELEAIKPMTACFDQRYVKRLHGTNVKTQTNKMELAEALMDDIRRFKEENNCDRLVMVWCGSTEMYIEESDVHTTLAKLEEGLRNNDENIPPSMIYVYAAVKMGIPYANGAPNLSCDVPAILELAAQTQTPIAGKDFKTGQTFMKTILAPGLKSRHLGIEGWFSTNILGNRDGEVLDAPENFKTKEVSKLGVLEQILEPDLYPELYGDMYHKVRINYYPPRGDAKEGWDNIDIRGWMDYPMQIKVDFLCRDSILAAPLVLDLAILLDLAKRSGESGIQHWLSYYLKSPQTLPGAKPQHDLFKQHDDLNKKLFELAGE